MLDREKLLEEYMKASRKEKARIVLRLYILDEEREENKTEKVAGMKKEDQEKKIFRILGLEKGGRDQHDYNSGIFKREVEIARIRKTI